MFMEKCWGVLSLVFISSPQHQQLCKMLGGQFCAWDQVNHKCWCCHPLLRTWMGPGHSQCYLLHKELPGRGELLQGK